MRAGEPFGAPEGVRLKRYSRSEIDIPNGRLATLCAYNAVPGIKFPSTCT